MYMKLSVGAVKNKATRLRKLIIYDRSSGLGRGPNLGPYGTETDAPPQVFHPLAAWFMPQMSDFVVVSAHSFIVVKF